MRCARTHTQKQRSPETRAHHASRFPRLASVQSDLASQVEAVNRKRKVDQMDVGPHLTRLESEWVGAVKKNLEIEGHCMRMENECAALQKRLAARGGHG